jgi:O-antigen/teichoic acid export membrane protein
MRGVQGLMLATGPVLAGMFTFAPEIEALIGRGSIATILRLLAAATLLKVVGTMVGSLFMAKGKANWSFYWSLFSMAVLIPAMYFYGLPRGVEGVALVLAASALFFLLVSQQLANRLIGLPFTVYLLALIRPGLVVAGVLATLLLTRPLLPGPPYAILVAGAALGILTTLAAFYLIVRDLCLSYWQSLRGR